MNPWKYLFILAPFFSYAESLNAFHEYEENTDLSTNRVIDKAFIADNADAPLSPGATTTKSSNSDYRTSQPSGMITPGVAPLVNRLNVNITADFIYWKAQQDGLDFATSGIFDAFGPIAAIPPSFTHVGKGEAKEPNFQFQPGFKVGLGLAFAHDGWDLHANYTWLNPNNHTTTINAPSDSYLTNTNWGDVYLYSMSCTLASASASWKLNFNVLDVDLGRNFFLSRFLTLRPFFGLKGAWLTENYDITYVPYSVIPLADGGFISATYKMREKIQGIGIRSGLSPVWHFARNLGLYGDLACSAMWNHFSVRRNDFFEEPSGPLNTINYEQSFHRVTPVLELGIGLTYMGWFSNEKYLLEVKAGWEEQVWFSMNKFIDPLLTPTGNLTTQGFTLKVGFTF